MYIYRERNDNKSYIVDTDTLKEFMIKTNHPEKTLRSKFDGRNFVNSDFDKTVDEVEFDELIPLEEICKPEIFDMKSIMVRGRLIHFLVFLDKYFYVIDFGDHRNQDGFKVACCVVRDDHISMYLTRWKGFREEIVFGLVSNKFTKQVSEKFYRLKDRNDMYRVNKMLLEGSFKGIESIRG